MNKTYKPVFIVGIPRSGTTLLYNCMAVHKDFAWFSQHDFVDTFSEPYKEFLDLGRRIFGLRSWEYNFVGSVARLKSTFEIPDEFGDFWIKWIGKEGWLTEEDVTDSAIQNLREAVSSLLEKKNKKRFLSKSPAHLVRIRLLNKVFPDALFINIIRDGRAVVSSMIKSVGSMKRFEKYFGIALKNGNQMDFDMLERHARQWVELNEEIQNCKNYLKPNQYYELKYEDLIEKPQHYLKEIFNFCEMEKQDIFKNSLIIFDRDKFSSISANLQSRNYKWKETFSEEETNRLDNIMGSWLQRFEYS